MRVATLEVRATPADVGWAAILELLQGPGYRSYLFGELGELPGGVCQKYGLSSNRHGPTRDGVFMAGQVQVASEFRGSPIKEVDAVVLCRSDHRNWKMEIGNWKFDNRNWKMGIRKRRRGDPLQPSFDFRISIFSLRGAARKEA